MSTFLDDWIHIEYEMLNMGLEYKNGYIKTDNLTHHSIPTHRTYAPKSLKSIAIIENHIDLINKKRFKKNFSEEPTFIIG